MNPPDHNKLITASAKSVLVPLGCTQKGRSRIWIDDHDWWVAVIEFQPSSWAKGSYLNVGACWLWNEKDHFSFDYGYRVNPFEKYENDDQFSAIAERLANSAKEALLELRHLFPTINQASTHLLDKQTENSWSNFHSAIASTLAGNLENAQSQFNILLRPEPKSPWEFKLKERAIELQALSKDSSSFRSEIISTIARTRTLLKLRPLKHADPFTP
jgi:hypothetical protein